MRFPPGGTPGYHTPFLDELAADGIPYDRAYCPAPVCTPARISMITGQYPSRHGAYQIGMAPVPALEGPTLAGELSRGGYATACIGKTHFVARQLEDSHIAGTAENPPEAFWDTFDGPYCGFEFLRHNAGHACNQPPNAHYRAWLKRRGTSTSCIRCLTAAGCPSRRTALIADDGNYPKRMAPPLGSPRKRSTGCKSANRRIVLGSP